MSDEVPPPDRDELFDTIIEPEPFIPAYALAQLSPEGRRLLFEALYREYREGSDAAKVAMNSTYGQTAWLPPEER